MTKKDGISRRDLFKLSASAGVVTIPGVVKAAESIPEYQIREYDWPAARYGDFRVKRRKGRKYLNESGSHWLIAEKQEFHNWFAQKLWLVAEKKP